MIDELLDRIKKLSDASDVLRIEREAARDEIRRAEITEALLVIQTLIGNLAYQIIEGREVGE